MTRRIVSMLALGILVSSSAAMGRRATAEGRSDAFQTNCVVCHGDDGKAQTEQGKKKGARDLTNKKWQDSVTDERLTQSITKGHGKMPKFGGKLSEDEIKTLVKEVRGLAKAS